MQETADQYRHRILSYLNGRDLIKMQAAAPAKLAKLLKGVSPAGARKRPAPGKWSIAEIVAHLADAELVGGYRIRAILGAPGCQVIGFDQDVWVTALHYDKRNLGKSFAQYGALRERISPWSRPSRPSSGSNTVCTTSEAPRPSKPLSGCSRDTTSITFNRLSEYWPQRSSSHRFRRSLTSRMG
jgi:DinB family protein